MTPEQTDLARRLVARPEWRWVEPMRWWHSHQGWRGRVRADAYAGEGHWRERGVLPDLTDDATGGVLLGRLWVEWGGVCTWSDRDGNHHVAPSPLDALAVHAETYGGTTLAEAAARALLACWEAADGR